MSIFVFSTLSITYILLLPVCIFILYLGYQQWKKQRSVSTAVTSHSDHFTYHSIAIQMNEFLGFTVFFCGGYFNLPEIMLMGNSVWSVASFDQAQLQLLTCVEHYLAVVHPVTYLGLRQTGEVRIRNISIGCVWFTSFVWLVVLYKSNPALNFILYVCIMVLYIITIFFCNISILCALKRPRPGEVGGNREKVDQSKQRAFYTIMAIMGVLLFRFCGNLITNTIYSLDVLSRSNQCVLMLCQLWFDLPSSLVLPLLFLQRAGKL
ncbi:hypothetical protein L3Q82_003751 [Scortum barcoo]|uniref:Uncharacterized protein n=1 Tax=Scortum barcoo TaxID=214431 RepID=A0ACB8X779_9TELE|nr:hypothetical protein L3Q82_003751 [Scortum barcoo]